MVTRELYSYLKNRKKSPNKAKKKCTTELQKKLQGQTKGVLGCKGHTWAGTIAKSNKDYQVKSHEGSTFFKKGPHFGQNSRPGESDPYDATDRHMFRLYIIRILVLFM